MLKAAEKKPSSWSKKDFAVALKGAAAILNKWGCSHAVSCSILRVSRSVYSSAVNGKLDEVKLDRDQLMRAALIASIHGSLRRTLTNPENLYGFMSMKNYNGFFNGQSPLSVIADGDMLKLGETFKRIDGIKGAGW